jgi:hypothetical protein
LRYVGWVGVRVKCGTQEEAKERKKRKQSLTYAGPSSSSYLNPHLALTQHYPPNSVLLKLYIPETINSPALPSISEMLEILDQKLKDLLTLPLLILPTKLFPSLASSALLTANMPLPANDPVPEAPLGRGFAQSNELLRSRAGEDWRYHWNCRALLAERRRDSTVWAVVEERGCLEC